MNLITRIKTQVLNLKSYLEPRRVVAWPLFGQMAGLVLSSTIMPFQTPVLAVEAPTETIALVLDTTSIHQMISLPSNNALNVTVIESKAQEQERLAAIERAKVKVKTKTKAVVIKLAKATILDDQREQNRQIVTQLCEETFGADQVSYCLEIVMRESGFNNFAQNSRSTAYGLFQFLDKTWKSYGYEKTSDSVIQAKAGMAYISKRYGTPQNAVSHSHAYGWY
jgi:hypothetical protein